MNTYEKILINIFTNATFKIIGAIELHVLKHSYNLSFFASVIAQEELAKLVILPFANELGDLEKVVRDKRGAYFHHGLKQKIFTSFGMQSRSYEEIEKLKQDSLYVGIETDLTPVLKLVDEKTSLIEIKHAVLLFTRFTHLHYARKDFSKDFRDGVYKLMLMVKGCVMEKMPIIDELIEEDRVSLDKKGPDELTEYMYEHLLRNPYEVISMFKAVFKDGYKERLAEIRHLDYKEFDDWLSKIYLDAENT